MLWGPLFLVLELVLQAGESNVGWGPLFRGDLYIFFVVPTLFISVIFSGIKRTSNLCISLNLYHIALFNQKLASFFPGQRDKKKSVYLKSVVKGKCFIKTQKLFIQRL